MEEKKPGSFLSGEDYLKTPKKKRQWLIEPLIPAKGIVNLYGKPKTGKSFASFGMGLAIANEDWSEWNGFPVRTHGPVMTLQIDTPEGELYERIESVQKGGYDISNMYFADMDIAPYPFNILLPQHQKWLEQQVAVIKPVLLIIDTLREAHEQDENDSTQMKRVINMIVKTARAAEAAVALISHSRKDSIYNTMGADSDIMDEGRGSSYVSGRMDTIMRFTGKNGKGHMHYKGRSKGADGKIPIVQDPDTGLIHLSGEYAKREQMVLQLLKEHPDWSQEKMAKHIADTLKISRNTAIRDIQKFKQLISE